MYTNYKHNNTRVRTGDYNSKDSINPLYCDSHSGPPTLQKRGNKNNVTIMQRGLVQEQRIPTSADTRVCQYAVCVLLRHLPINLPCAKSDVKTFA